MAGQGSDGPLSSPQAKRCSQPDPVQDLQQQSVLVKISWGTWTGWRHLQQHRQLPSHPSCCIAWAWGDRAGHEGPRVRDDLACRRRRGGLSHLQRRTGSPDDLPCSCRGTPAWRDRGGLLHHGSTGVLPHHHHRHALDVWPGDYFVYCPAGYYFVHCPVFL